MTIKVKYLRWEIPSRSIYILMKRISSCFNKQHRFFLSSLSILHQITFFSRNFFYILIKVSIDSKTLAGIEKSKQWPQNTWLRVPTQQKLKIYCHLRCWKCSSQPLEKHSNLRPKNNIHVRPIYHSTITQKKLESIDIHIE